MQRHTAGSGSGAVGRGTLEGHAGKFLRWARVAHQEWQPRPRARFRGLEKVPMGF